MLNIILRQFVSFITLMAFVFLNAMPLSAQEVLSLPAPASLISLSTPIEPVVLKGIKVDIKKPFKFDFIMDIGQSKASEENLRQDANKLIRYFLAALTVPDRDLWVNLSPYEKDRIITDEFSLTEMGRDLLAQDYILKQITSSLIYPESPTGKVFWDKIYALAYQKYGTTDIPTDTFNKVWIVPDTATVNEQPSDDGRTASAFVTASRLKVMLESDYKLLREQEDNGIPQESQEMAKKVLREVVVPVLEKEVNEGENFSLLRQIYYSLILAKWYKETLKASILSRKYADQSKVSGVDLADKNTKQDIYLRYLESFKKGVFNYIKEEREINSEEILPRKYFSGGFDMTKFPINRTRAVGLPAGQPNYTQGDRLWNILGDFAMTGQYALPKLDQAAMVAPSTSQDAMLLREDRPGLEDPRLAEKHRAALDDLLRNIAWAYELYDDILTRKPGESLSVNDLQKLQTQLDHADVLGSMQKIKDGDWLVVFGRWGKTSSRNGTKDLNDVLGEHGNNLLIGLTRQRLRALMKAEGFDFQYATYNRNAFSFTGDSRDWTAVLSGIQDRLVMALNTWLNPATSPETDENIKAQYQIIWQKLQSAGISIDQQFLSFGVNRASVTSDDPQDRVRQQIMSFVRTQEAMSMARASGVMGSEFKAVDFEALINANQVLRGEFSALMTEYTEFLLADEDLDANAIQKTSFFTAMEKYRPGILKEAAQELSSAQVKRLLNDMILDRFFFVNMPEDTRRSLLVQPLSAEISALLERARTVPFSLSEDDYRRLNRSLLESMLPQSVSLQRRSFKVLRDDVSKILRDQLSWEVLQDKAKTDANYAAFVNEMSGKAAFERLQIYFNQLGVVDFIKNWQLDLGEALKWREAVLQVKDKLAKVVDTARDGPVQIDEAGSNLLGSISDVLSRDPKVPGSIQSKLAFYAGTVKEERYGVLSFDVINMGGMNIRDFEVLMQRLYQTKDLPKEEREKMQGDLLLTAADSVTQSFQVKFRNIQDELRQQNVPVRVQNIGGDEGYIVLDRLEDITPDLLAKVQQIAGVRVVGSRGVEHYYKQFGNRYKGSGRDGQIVDVRHMPEALVLASVLQNADEQGIQKYLKPLEKSGKKGVVIEDELGQWRVYALNAKGQLEEEKDFAQQVNNNQYGGIDLNSELLALTTQGQRAKLDWAMTNDALDGVEINGLVPVILNMQPIKNLPAFLSAKTSN